MYKSIVDIETQGKLHNIRSKIMLGITLTSRERSYYLLYCNTKEIEEFKKIDKRSVINDE